MDFTLHHIAISVSDVEKSEEFYRHFGFKEIAEYHSEDHTFTIKHLKKGEIIIELFQFKDCITSENYPLWEDLKHTGYRHIAFKVKNIQKAREELVKKGLIDSSTEIKKGKTGILYFFLRDPDGNFVEIVEDRRKL